MNYRVGEIVIHKRIGRGRVVKASPHGFFIGKNDCIVEFDEDVIVLVEDLQLIDSVGRMVLIENAVL